MKKLFSIHPKVAIGGLKGKPEKVGDRFIINPLKPGWSFMQYGERVEVEGGKGYEIERGVWLLWSPKRFNVLHVHFQDRRDTFIIDFLTGRGAK